MNINDGDREDVKNNQDVCLSTNEFILRDGSCLTDFVTFYFSDR